MNYDFDAMTRDQIIMDLVTTHGKTLNAATKLYVKLKKDAGLAVGIVSHKADAFKLLGDLNLADVIEPKPLVDQLCVEFGVKPDTAMNYIRAYAEETGRTVKLQAASEAILDWIVTHAPTVDDDAAWDEFDAEFKDWMTEQGKSPSNINEYRKGIRLHRMLVAR